MLQQFITEHHPQVQEIKPCQTKNKRSNRFMLSKTKYFSEHEVSTNVQLQNLISTETYSGRSMLQHLQTERCLQAETQDLISLSIGTVHHLKFFASLIKSGLPKWVITILSNWYSKLQVSVRWKTATSSKFNVCCGVRNLTQSNALLMSRAAATVLPQSLKYSIVSLNVKIAPEQPNPFMKSN